MWYEMTRTATHTHTQYTEAVVHIHTSKSSAKTWLVPPTAAALATAKSASIASFKILNEKKEKQNKKH